MRGENFPGALMGQRAPVGFFTTRFVEAGSAAEAEAAALRLLKDDETLGGIRPEDRSPAAKVYFEQIEVVDVDASVGPGRGFTFFPMEERRSLAASVLPPLLLLWPASTTHGPGLFFAGALFLLVGLVSLVRIAWLLLRPERSRSMLLRPVLAVAICGLALAYTQASLVPAREFAREAAAAVQRQCDLERKCPAAIAGWPARHDAYSSQISVGQRVKWPLMYHSDGGQFHIWLYKALDVGEQWSGGVSPPDGTEAASRVPRDP